jgi:hypothetical protein
MMATYGARACTPHAIHSQKARDLRDAFSRMVATSTRMADAGRRHAALLLFFLSCRGGVHGRVWSESMTCGGNWFVSSQHQPKKTKHTHTMIFRRCLHRDISCQQSCGKPCCAALEWKASLVQNKFYAPFGCLQSP